MDCQWHIPTKSKGKYVYRCQRCQQKPMRLPYLLADPQKLRRNCPAQLTLPSTLLRIGNFSIATVKHYLRGVPTCTQEEIDARFAICQACPFLKDGVCAHKKCGCGVSNKAGYFSKLAWADQECPIGKWGKIKRGWFNWRKDSTEEQSEQGGQDDD